MINNTLFCESVDQLRFGFRFISFLYRGSESSDLFAVTRFLKKSGEY